MKNLGALPAIVVSGCACFELLLFSFAEEHHDLREILHRVASNSSLRVLGETGDSYRDSRY